jgi:hypothetical protein
MEVFATELGIWLRFVKTSEFREGGGDLNPPPSVRHCLVVSHFVWRNVRFTTVCDIRTAGVWPFMLRPTIAAD